MARNFVHVLGIDLGGGKGKKTALATLRVDGGLATVVDIAPRNGALPFYDAALIETIRQYGDETLLCIDAPLTLPPCLRCAVPICPGQQACVDPSVVEMRALAGASRSAARPRQPPRQAPHHAVHPARHRGAPGAPAGHPGARGAGPGHRPPGGAGRAPAARAGRSVPPEREPDRGLSRRRRWRCWGWRTHFKKHLRERETRARILEALSGELRFGPGVWRELCIQSDHLFEAVISAFTGFLWARDGWMLPPSAQPRDDQARLRDGWILDAAGASRRKKRPPPKGEG